MFKVGFFTDSVRKQKERYAQSQIRKQANRMSFGEVSFL